MITKKTITVDLTFYGSGKVTEIRPGSFAGGVPDPDVAGDVGFEVWREVEGEEGVWNPIHGEDTVDGGFQISVSGSSEGYRKLGLYLLALAELDTSADPDFHEHHQIVSEDGRSRFHLILRKAPE